MIVLIFSAAFVGLVHSLAPGHWLPVVLVAKTRRWPMPTAILGALISASGHIINSILLGGIGIMIGMHLIASREEVIERYSGLLLVGFGLLYAVAAFFRHFRCVGHSHHGPEFKKKKGPFLFLFTLGFTPCVAVLPVFAAAIPFGYLSVILTVIGFGLGVITALVGATMLVSFGVMKLDHPLLEHYGDVITGLAIALMGLVLFFISH